MATTERSGRGGARRGAGRKPEFNERGDLKVSFERADLDALGRIAEAGGVSVGSLIREAVRAYLKRQRGRKQRG